MPDEIIDIDPNGGPPIIRSPQPDELGPKYHPTVVGVDIKIIDTKDTILEQNLEEIKDRQEKLRKMDSEAHIDGKYLANVLFGSGKETTVGALQALTESGRKSLIELRSQSDKRIDTLHDIHRLFDVDEKYGGFRLEEGHKRLEDALGVWKKNTQIKKWNLTILRALYGIFGERGGMFEIIKSVSPKFILICRNQKDMRTVSEPDLEVSKMMRGRVKVSKKCEKLTGIHINENTNPSRIFYFK